MDLAECYRLLELSSGATSADIKASYRRLARRVHPDVSAADPQSAQEQFIQLTAAYKALMAAMISDPQPSSTKGATSAPQASVRVRVQQSFSKLSEPDRKLKEHVYTQLQQCLKAQRFPRAVTLVEGLAQRLPQDSEVKQWQAIAYQCWARALIRAGQTVKARSYLKKALRTDPHNRALWLEVERDFRRLEALRP